MGHNRPGSSINVISKSLYDSISDRHKLYFEQLSESEIRLANNDKIRINGISKLQATIHQKNEIIETYIIPKTSHPLILGTEYLRENKIVLDFSDFSCNQKTVPVKTGKRIELEPNTEYLTFGKLPNYVTVGLQGICVNSKFSVNHKFLVAKSLVVVPVNRKVPIKLLNASNVKITIPKGKNIAEFSTLSNEYTYVAMSEKSEIPEVQNIQLVANENGLRTDNSEQQCDITDSPDRQEILTKIKTDFDLSDHLTHDQKSELAECLFDNLDLFVTKENPNLGYTHLVEHKIHLKPNAVGKHHKPYRLPPYKREVLREQLDNLLEQGIVVPVSEQEELPITSPIVLVTKRNEASNSKTSTQSYRFVCDFRHLNAQTEDFKYVIPNLQELTESFAEIVPNYITSIDLSSGFFQMGISAESSRYTAFNTCFGTYKFLRLPMGLKTAPNTFQLLMDKVLRGLKFRTCLCYLDDVLICSETFEKHLDDIKEIFKRFRDAGLKLGQKKCHFASETCIFLGHEISKHGIRPPKDRVKAIVDFPAPQNIKQLRRTIGLFNWFKKFPPFRFTVYIGCGYFIKRNRVHALSEDPTKEKPNIIRFGSKSLSRWQQSYGPTKLELLGMVTSILDCADYLRGTQFIVECDHQALQPLFMKQFKGAIYERWLAILQQFTFEIQYKPAEQMKVADALSRCENPENIPIESPAEDDPFFPLVTENTGEIRLPGGVKFVDLFESNDNTDVVVQAIDMVADKHIDLYNVETDEHNSLNDPYDADTDESDSYVHNRKKKFGRNNQNVEQLANTLRDFQVGANTSNIKKLQRKDSDLKKIIAYLEDDVLPDSQKESRRILLESCDFILVDDVLYHRRKAKSERTKSMSEFQLVIPRQLISQILKIAHDSPLGGHSGIQNTLDSVRERYYFARMGKIISEYVQSCHECQSRKVSNLKTKAKIVAYPTPSEPFQVWQMDIFGPLVSSNNANTYVFTAVDAFSNFLFAVPLRNNDAISVSQAIFNFFCNFGVCSTVISDQGSEFIGKCTMEVCKMLNVEQEFTPSMMHHCLGRCERTHRTLAERLTPYVLDNKQWEEMLPGIVFSINSCVNSGSKYSAFEIVYGKRPNFPLSPSYIVDFKDIPKDVKTYVENLDARLNIIREHVKLNTLVAQRKNGDNVYLSREPVGQGRKFQHIYDGPFTVTCLPSAHLVILRDPTGKRNFRRPVHINRLKLAHIRVPLPAPYFNQQTDESENTSSKSDNSSSSVDRDTSENSKSISTNVTTESEALDTDVVSQHDTTNLNRLRRNIQKPVRYRDDNFIDPDKNSGFMRKQSIESKTYSCQAKRRCKFRLLDSESRRTSTECDLAPFIKITTQSTNLATFKTTAVDSVVICLVKFRMVMIASPNH
ncbi:unnamed protein product [Mytilus edulis]|uniref:RNA-directed DNA polymerase n=1 Tax=Mytilus edulis TaxID=6550 RepID=A0A8S3REI9_MYTED|nr:unnamed protein product [Mytilus edulis]